MIASPWLARWMPHVVAVLLVVAMPAWDRVETRRIRSATDPRAKVQSYRRVVAVLWLLTALLLAAVPLRDLARPPAFGWLAAHLAAARSATLPIVVGMLVGLAVPMLAMRASPRARERTTASLAKFAWFLPATAAERRWWVAVCVSAGVCEEVLYRGFLIGYLAALPFGLGATGAALVAALVFAAAHTYQGVAGASAVAVLALAFTALFVVSGSLWLPMLLHTALDLRILLLWRGESAPGAAAEPAPVGD